MLVIAFVDFVVLFSGIFNSIPRMTHENVFVTELSQFNVTIMFLNCPENYDYYDFTQY